MKNLFLKVIYLTLFCCCTFYGLAQDETTVDTDTLPTLRIVLNDGTIIQGKKLAQTSKGLVVESFSLGKLNIPYSNISTFEELDPSRFINGNYWFENPSSTRNLFSPNGYGLRKGEGYYQNFLLFWNQVSYGITDNFTIGAGIEAVSLLATGRPIFLITPKFSIPIEENKFNLGIGGLVLNIPFEDDNTFVGTLYGVATLGSRDINASIGLGFGFIDGEFSSTPVVTLSGNYRVSEGFGFVTDNWIIPDGGVITTFGGRLIRESISWDFALGMVVSDGFTELIPIPLIGILVPFGKLRR